MYDLEEVDIKDPNYDDDQVRKGFCSAVPKLSQPYFCWVVKQRNLPCQCASRAKKFGENTAAQLPLWPQRPGKTVF